MWGRGQPLCTLFSLLLVVTLSSVCVAEIKQESQQFTFLDKAHKGISASLAAPARWFDNFFHDPQLDDDVPRLADKPADTLLRLRGSVITEEGERLSIEGKLKARLRLPNLKRHFHLIFSSEGDDIRDATVKDARIDRDLTNNEENSLALQYTQEQSTIFSLTHRIKVDIEDDELNPQVQSRARYSIPVATDSIISLTQSIFWENEVGFGEESRVDYDLPLQENTLFRGTAQGFFSESSHGYEWLGLLQLLHSFNHKKALILGSYVAGETRPQNHVTEYNAFIKFRQRVARKWFFIELKPELIWPRETNFKTTSIFTLTFEVQFVD